MSSRTFGQLAAIVVALLWTGCVGEVKTTAADIYEGSEHSTFDKLAQRQTITGQLPSDTAEQAGQGPTQGQTPSPSEPSSQYEEHLSVTTESRCHPGDLDFGLAGFWDMLGNGSAIDGLSYTFSLEAADGTLLGSMTLGADELINAQQQQAVHVMNQITEAFKVNIPESLAQSGSFYANLFACVDADKDGACADEEVKPVEQGGTNTPGGLFNNIPGMENLANLANLPGMDNLPGADKPFGSRLVSTQGLKVTVQDGTLSFEKAEGQESDSNQLANWFDASTFTQGLLKNIQTPGGQASTSPLSLSLAVRSGADQCRFAARDNGCFVKGTMIRVAGDQTLPIEQLIAGSSIATADGRELISLRAVVGPEAEPTVTIETSKGHALTVTSKHPVVTKAGLKLAKDVTRKDRVQTASGEYVTISAIKRQPYSGMVYNFALPGDATKDHLIIAEGLVVGDLYLQEKLVGAH